MYLVLIFALQPFSACQTPSPRPWQSEFVKCEVRETDICGRILKIPPIFQMQNAIVVYRQHKNPLNPQRPPRHIDSNPSDEDDKKTISFGTQITTVKTIGPDRKFSMLKMSWNKEIMSGAIIDDLTIEEPTFFNFLPEFNRTIFTMINHDLNLTSFYDMHLDVPPVPSGGNPTFPLHHMDVDIYDPDGVLTQPLVSSLNGFMIQNVGGVFKNVSLSGGDTPRELQSFDVVRNYRPIFLKSREEFLMIGSYNYTDYRMAALYDSIALDSNNFYFIDLFFRAYHLVGNNLWVYNESGNNIQGGKNTKCVAMFDLFQIKNNVKPEQNCLYILREPCIDCTNIHSMAVNMNEDKIFLQFDTSIKILVKDKKGDFIHYNHIPIFKNSCVNLIYVEQMNGVYCQDQSMQEIRWFGEEFSRGDTQTIPAYMLYLIFALSLAFAIAIGILIYVNRKMKRKNKEDIENILIEHSENMRQNSYVMNFKDLGQSNHDSNDVCGNCGGCKGLTYNIEADSLNTTTQADVYNEKKRCSSSNFKKDCSSSSNQKFKGNLCEKHDFLSKNKFDKD